MEKKLALASKFYKPYILSNLNRDVENLLHIELKPTKELSNEESTVKSIDFCIVLDVSGSMSDLLPGTIKTTKLDAAINAAKMLYDFITPQDTISIVLYDSLPYVVMNKAVKPSRNEFNKAIDQARQYGRSTNITAALRKAREILSNTSGDIKRIIFLTDGLPTDDTEESGYEEAKLLAERRIVVTALGIGRDFNYKYIERLAAITRGTTNHIQSEKDAIEIFKDSFEKAKSTVAKNVRLKIKFSDKVRVSDHYRANPQITYLGKLQLDSTRTLTIDLDDIEYNKKYEYIFEITIPQLIGKFEGPFRIGQAILEYEIPAVKQKISENFDLIIEATKDSAKAESRYESVNELHTRCIINKLDGKMNEALARRDGETVAKILKEIIHKAEDIGDYDLKDTYSKVLNEYVAKRTIPPEALITASHRSTRVVSNDNEEDTIDPSEIFQ